MLALLLPGCALPIGRRGTLPPPQEKAEVPNAEALEQVGNASWYGPAHDGKETASGETFDQNKLTAAPRTLPLGTKAVVTNLENGKSVDVTINDRGPYVKGRIIDLSRAAARQIGMSKEGVAKVKIETRTSHRTR
jgi:rare lipoprotein A